MRKKVMIGMALFVLGITAWAQRTEIPLNEGWKFSLKPETEISATAGWDSVNIPHTWNALDAQNNTEFLHLRQGNMPVYA